MSSSGCGVFLMKVFLVIFNAIFFIGGAGLVFIGVWLTWYDDSWNNYLPEVINNYVDVDITAPDVDNSDQSVQNMLYGVMAVGGFVVLLSFLGCRGALKESSCMLAMYGGLILLILLGEVAIVALSIVFKETITTELQQEMSKQASQKVEVYNGSVEVGKSHAWHLMQKELKCCGGINYTDYRKNPNFNQSVNPVPVSCCQLTTSGKGEIIPTNKTECFKEAMNDVLTADFDYLYSEGCYDTLESWISQYLWIVIAGGGCLVFLQLLAVICACCVRRHQGKDH